MKKEILDNELVKIGEISKEFDVEKVFLFGSCLESCDPQVFS